MEDFVSKLEELKAKRESIKTEATRNSAKIDEMNSQRSKIAEAIMAKYGVAVEDIESRLEELSKESDELFAKATEVLGNVNL